MIKRLRRPQTLRGDLSVPGDKSITHRAFIFNAMARGTARIRNFGRGAACYSTLGCLRALGVPIEEPSVDEVVVRGRGIEGFQPPMETLDAGNSATTIRLMSGLLASLPFPTAITGDESLRRRPMGRVMEPLRLMGAEMSGSGDKGAVAPLKVRGGNLRGITYQMPVASGQVKSAILIAGVNARGRTIVSEPAPSRDHTERMLRAMGATVVSEEARVAIDPARLRAMDITIPGDISSAAFWLVAACIHPDADIVVGGVGVNPSRTGILDALLEMGAQITLENERVEGGEPVADIRARSSRLRGISVRGAMIPRIIDELPVLAVAAAVASGVTEIRDAAELRVKESDRVATTSQELRKLGATVDELPDGMVVHGGSTLGGAACHSHGDHRVAMLLAVASVAAEGEVAIENAEATDISYPEFWADLERINHG